MRISNPAFLSTLSRLLKISQILSSQDFGDQHGSEQSEYQKKHSELKL
jgi:hypothetical protein